MARSMIKNEPTQNPFNLKHHETKKHIHYLGKIKKMNSWHRNIKELF